jgi:glutathione S-transferase
VKLRGKFFNKAFFEKHELPVAKGGYPDMGCGRYADKLTLEEWQQFNNAQRGHQNYVEQMGSIVASMLVCGLFFPRIAFGFGLMYVVGRELYAMGYRSSGPSGRRVGAITQDIALLVIIGAAAYGGFVNGGGVAGFRTMFNF